MKNRFLIAFAMVTSLMIVSCAEDGTADIVINDNSVTNTTNNTNTGGNTGGNTSQNVELNGNITADLTLDADNTYTITGPTVVTDGVTLTIPAGMTIKAAATGADVYLAVAQGGKIIAEGTSTQPIVMTSASQTPNAGDWGGLIILGKAPINSVASGTATSEIGNLPYGGSDANDNSGILRFVRVEYSGGKASGQSENNGISFYGVGNGTTVEYIQVFEGKDDGVEFFGGTVNVSKMSVVNAEDDSIDWTEGYSGTITDAYVKHGTTHDKGIEADGFNTDLGNNSSPVFWSSPSITNLTIVGLGSGSSSEAVRLRAGTRVFMENVHISGYGEGFDLDDAETGNGVTSQLTFVDKVKFDDVTTKMKNDTGASFTIADFLLEDANATGTDYAAWGAGWTRQ